MAAKPPTGVPRRVLRPDRPWTTGPASGSEAQGKAQRRDAALSTAQMFVEELGDEGLDLGVFEAAVTAARDGVQGGLDAGLLERVQKDLALVVRHERVFVAVDDQEGGIVFRHVRDRIGPLDLVLVLLDGPADPYLERRRPVLDMPQFSKRQVGRRRDWFPLLVYRGHRPTRELLWLVSMAKIYSNRRLADLHRRLMEMYYARRSRNYQSSPEMVFARNKEAQEEGGAELIDAGTLAGD